MSGKLKRFLRWTSGGFFALLLVGLAMLLFGDLSSFRERAQSAASEALGRDVLIEGDMRLLPLLPLTVELSEISVANAAWSNRPMLAEIEEIHIGLSVWSLLFGDVRLESLELLGLKLFPGIRADGARSWLVGSERGGGSVPPSQLKLIRGQVDLLVQSSSAVYSVALERVELSAAEHETELYANINWPGQAVVVKATTGGANDFMSLDTPVPLDLTMEGAGWSFTASGERLVSGGWDTEIEFAADDTDVLSTLLNVVIAPLGRVELSSGLTFSDGLAKLNDLEIRSERVTVNGEIAVSSKTPRPSVIATLSAREFDVQGLVERGTKRDEKQLEVLLDRELPFAALVGLGFDLATSLHVDRIFDTDLELGPVRLDARVMDGAGRAEFSLGGSGGEVVAELDIELLEGVPQFAGKVSTLGVDPKWLDDDVDAFIVRGDDIQVNAAFTTQGTRLREILEALDATLLAQQLTLLADSSENAEPIIVELLKLSATDGALGAVEFSGNYRGSPVESSLTTAISLLSLADDLPVDLELSSRFGPLKLETQGTLTTPMSAPSLKAAFVWATDDVGALAPLVGSEPLNLFGSSGNLELSADTKQWSLGSISAVLGDSKVEGLLEHTLDGETRVLAGSLRFAELDVAQMQRLSSVFSPKPSPAQPADGTLPKPLALRMLLDLEVNRMHGVFLNLSELKTRVELEDRTFKFETVTARWYDRPVAGRAEIRLATKNPGAHIELNAQDFPLDSLSKILATHESLSGHAGAIDVRLDAKGMSANGWRDTVVGRVTIRDGALFWKGVTREVKLGQVNLELLAEADQLFSVDATAIYLEQPMHLALKADSLISLRANQPTELMVDFKVLDFEAKAKGVIEKPLVLEGLALEIDGSAQSLDVVELVSPLPFWLHGPMSFSGSVEYSNEQLTLNNLAMAVMETDIRGDLSLPLDADGQLSANLESDVVTIPDLLEVDSVEADGERAPYVIPSLPLSHAIPKNVNGKVRWRIGKLWIAASAFRDVTLDATVEGGALDFRNAGTTDQTNGTYAIVFTIDPAHTPSGTLTASGDSFDFGWLLPDTGSGKPWWPADFDVDLRGPATRLDWFLGHANGEVHFIAGKTDGAEFARWDLDLISLMVPSLGEKPKDQLSCMVLNLDVEDGVASTDGLIAETQSVLIAGGGKLDLRSEKLGLLITARPTDTTLTGVTVPLKVEGSLREPVFTPAGNEMLLSASTLLLGVANPIALIGSYVYSQVNKGNRCESGLENARKKHGMEPSVELETSNGGLFGFLSKDRERSKPVSGNGGERTR